MAGTLGEAKQLVPKLKELLETHKIKMPPVEQTPVNFGAALMATKKASDGSFDVEQAAAAGEEPEDPAEAKKRKRNDAARAREEKNKKKREEELGSLPNLNNPLAEIFEQLGHYFFLNKDDDKRTFKGVAAKKAAKALREHTAVIKSGKEGMALKGIGKGSAEKIDEFLSSGKCAELEALKERFGPYEKDD